MVGRIARVSVAVAAAALVVSLAPAEADPPRKRLGAAVAPIRLVPTGRHPMDVAGLHSYLGTIELDAAHDGLVVVNRLSLERYLLGLNEVPTDWPMAALRAQAIAARTYALWTLDHPRGGSAAVYGFDICASYQCQVFSGADVLATKDGHRWRQAVSDTARQAVVYRGEPILARYHSTSGGATLDNSQAFPGEPDYPYLQAVRSTTEKAAPLYRWVVRFRLGDLQELLERAGWWGRDKGRLARVTTIRSSTGLHYPDVLFKGKRGVVVRTAEELRDVLRDLAPSMFPARYPSFALTSSGRLPETLPSNRIEISTRDKVAEVVGRGWGHGVGMSQWGAYGMAAQGSGYTDILTHYYTDTSVEEVPAPGVIEVGVSWARPSVAVSGSFRIVDGRGRTLVKRALGDWEFRWAGAGAVAIDPPRGLALPLEVGIVRAPERVEPGKAAVLTVTLSRPATVRTLTSPRTVGTSSVEVKGAGRRRLVWLAPNKTGTYEVTVRASTGKVTRDAEPVVVEVVGRDDAGDQAGDAARARDGPSGRLLAVFLLVALGVIVVAVTITR